MGSKRKHASANPSPLCHGANGNQCVAQPSRDGGRVRRAPVKGDRLGWCQSQGLPPMCGRCLPLSKQLTCQQKIDVENMNDIWSVRGRKKAKNNNGEAMELGADACEGMEAEEEDAYATGPPNSGEEEQLKALKEEHLASPKVEERYPIEALNSALFSSPRGKEPPLSDDDDGSLPTFPLRSCNKTALDTQERILESAEE